MTTKRGTKQVKETSTKAPKAGVSAKKSGAAATAKKASNPARGQAKKAVAPRKTVQAPQAEKPGSRQAVAGGPEAGGASGEHMVKRQLADFRKVLISVRERVANQVSSLKGDSLTRVDEVNPVEDGTDAFERQFALSLASTENDALFEIDEAIRRIDEGSYGICESCSAGISEARLRALPFVRMCIGCQSEVEKGRGRLARPSALRRP